jgi:hypothetical protein
MPKVEAQVLSLTDPVEIERITDAEMGTSASDVRHGIVIQKENGAPEEIRTPDPQIRSLVLYPAELRALIASQFFVRA